MSQCTIYLLKNTINSKVYVGQTWYTLPERWKGGAGYVHCAYLHNAINKYGADKFCYEILATTSNQENADYLEDYYINYFDSRNKDKGYNIREGGSRGKNSDETIIKMSKAQMGEKNAMFGKRHSPDTKKLMSENREDSSGEKNPRAVLTEKLVEEIRIDTRSERVIAKEYGVSRSTINSIKRGINWRNNG